MLRVSAKFVKFGQDWLEKNNDKKKVHVSDIMKLKPQVLGDEAEGSVFGGANLIACEVIDGVAILVFGIRR